MDCKLIQHAISMKGVVVLALPGDVAAAELEFNTSNNFYTQPMNNPSHENLQNWQALPRSQ
jgi:thiamine pyrophosphate-dependent acetolactate synthase large subunit-like protein